jgi:hypothetical protein
VLVDLVVHGAGEGDLAGSELGFLSAGAASGAGGLQTGDQLVVTKLDRLGRSLEHLIALSKQLQEREVDLVVLDQGIDTSTAVGRMFFQILASIASRVRFAHEGVLELGNVTLSEVRDTVLSHEDRLRAGLHP